MAVIKIFDSVGTKTLVLMGNVEEQPYDEEVTDEDINEIAEETDDGF